MHDDAGTIARLYAQAGFRLGRGVEMDEYREAAIAYLKLVKASIDFSLNELAQRVGVSHTTLTRPLAKPDYPYAPKYATLQKIALATGIPLPPQLTETQAGAPAIVALKVLVVRGMVAAGMWQAVDAMQDTPLGEAPMVENPQYLGLDQWAELLRGPSMNLSYEDGDYLHVVSVPDLGYMPRPGDDVIVERRNGQEGTVERTCKRVALVDGEYALVGHSSVERWNAPLPLAGGEDCLVQLVGLVVGHYHPRARR